MYQQNRVTVPKINYKKGGFKIGSSVMKNTEFGNSDFKMKNVEMPYNYQKSNDMSSYRQNSRTKQQENKASLSPYKANNSIQPIRMLNSESLQKKIHKFQLKSKLSGTQFQLKYNMEKSIDQSLN